MEEDWTVAAELGEDGCKFDDGGSLDAATGVY